MTEILSVFGVYDFAIRDALVLTLVALGIYLLLSAGIFAVPQVGLMAVGSYTSAVLSVDVGTPFPVSLAVGALAGGAVGILLAALLGRLNGIYLAIASIAFSEIVRVAVLNLPGTGGAQGKVGIPRDANDLYILLSLAGGITALAMLAKSRHGLAIAAMREDTLMARHQGVNVVAYRIGLFGISGLLAGLAGGLYVHMSGFVEPGQFSFDLLTELLAVVVIGGMTFVAGSLVGAVVIFGLPQVLSGLAEYQVIANGLLIVLVVGFAPGGILGLLSSWLGRHAPEPSAPPFGAEAGEPPDAPVKEILTATTIAETDVAPVLVVTGVSMLFGGLAALDHASLEAHSGEVLGVIGPNGSGKTTLLNVLSGVYRPATGTGTLAGLELGPYWGSPHRLAAKGVARTFQTIRLIDSHSVLDNVMLGLHLLDGGPGKTDRELLARDVLEQQGLSHVADVETGWLPYGVRRRVEIARAVASQPNLLLLDEPTAGMNPEERRDVFNTVSKLRAAGIAVIVVEHDVAMMREYCDRLIVLDFGKVIASGDPTTVLKMKEVIHAYVGSGTHA